MITPNRFYEVDKHDKQFLSFLEGIPHEEVYVNTLIEEELIRKLGYLELFPNYLYATYPVKASNFESVIKKNKIEKEDLADCGCFLIHAGCMEVYPYYEKYRQGENRIFSLKAKVFRNETTLSEIRLNEFTLREFVCVGTKDFIEKNMTYFEEKTLAYAKSIGLDASFKTASDVFYPTEKSKVMKKLQEKNKKKLELVVNYKDQSLAIASINYHSNHFSKLFGFEQDGIQTACIGFGIERWIESERMIIHE